MQPARQAVIREQLGPFYDELHTRRDIVIKHIALALASLALACSPCVAGEFGEPDISLVPEADQWAYARGEWEVTTWFRNDDGDMQQAERKAKVRTWYWPDGLTVQSTFEIGDDFFSVQIRTYDTTQKKWISHFVNAKRQRRATTESRWTDGEMITLNVQGYSGKDEFMTREVDSDISADRFVKTVRRSYDQGGSWGPVNFRMEFNRIR
jgi:hypothetical protein